MKIFKISYTSVPIWITYDGNYYQSPKGHAVLVEQNPSIFNIQLSELKNQNDPKEIAINKGNVAIRISHQNNPNKPTLMAIMGNKNSIRNLSNKILSIARRNNINSYIIYINNQWDFNMLKIFEKSILPIFARPYR